MKEKVEKFIKVLKEYGEFYFTQGNIKDDYEYITRVLKAQGYYSGCKYKLYFNKSFDLIKVEERF